MQIADFFLVAIIGGPFAFAAWNIYSSNQQKLGANKAERLYNKMLLDIGRYPDEWERISTDRFRHIPTGIAIRHTGYSWNVLAEGRPEKGVYSFGPVDARFDKLRDTFKARDKEAADLAALASLTEAYDRMNTWH